MKIVHAYAAQRVWFTSESVAPNFNTKSALFSTNSYQSTILDRLLIPPQERKTMGVRFACHACGKRLNIKSELAGRRGICPSCSVRFRIPIHDTETSTPIQAAVAIDDSESSDSVFTAGDDDRSSTEHPEGTATAATETREPTAGNASGTTPQMQTGPSSAPQSPARTPAGTLEEMLGGRNATWYIRPPSGGQYGPADGPTLGQWIQEGRVSETAMLWRDGWADWKTAHQMLPIFSPQSPTPSPADHSTPPPAAPISAPEVQRHPAPRDPTGDLRTGRKVLPSNKKTVSRKRIAISVMLACIFVVLVVALILVLKQPPVGTQ